MRITQRAVALTSLQGLNRNLDAVGRLQQQLTSGRLISNPSDSPTGANRAMQTRSEQAATAQQARNISDAKSWLESSDSTIQGMLDMVRKVRDLTVQGASTGSSSESSRSAIATEVASLREALVGLANRNVQGRPIFGGVTPGTAAYAADGTYVGQAGPPITRRVSDVEQIRIDITGPEAFVSADGEDLFAVVGAIAGDVVTDPDKLSDHLNSLDAVMNTMLGALADIGTRSKRIEGAQQINTDLSLSLSSLLAETENIDLPKTIMDLEMQKVGYEAALAATAKALQPTLVDFLR
ncbi:flagellar hook-associated protein 3 [Geodermatophilus sabuli]|uniref:Flagellar hook-associated protein 3 n=1 Tax=Geodermatophilus sabuli TaxID=1564158 RepID=A0A7K3W0G8_9ACTN|nr:flagellar hook-associated protein FlgL [Geodermatophilus sabuli]NEK57843.1 flagellar hook-associated protein 3 [Geodermatophilus sabuli]